MGCLAPVGCRCPPVAGGVPVGLGVMQRRDVSLTQELAGHLGHDKHGLVGGEAGNLRWLARFSRIGETGRRPGRLLEGAPAAVHNSVSLGWGAA